MLKANCDIHFTFSKNDIQRASKRDFICINTLLKSLSTGRGKNKPIAWEETFPSRPLDGNFYDTLDAKGLMSVYLLDGDDINDLEKHGCLLISSAGKEITTLMNLFIGEEQIPTKKCSIRGIANWDIIFKNASPCTDIIVVDPYIFAQSDILYEYNSYCLLAGLSKINKKRNVNIVIFTYGEYKDTNGNRQISFTSIERNMKKQVENECGITPNITFVKLPQKEEHDRMIFTNYKMFDSGDSFKYFDDNGVNHSHGRWLYINSHINQDNMNNSMALISDLQELINRQKLAGIFGDKISSFLKFT